MSEQDTASTPVVPYTKRLIVFLDSGLQKIFVPLRMPENSQTLLKTMKKPQSLQEALEELEACEA